jgi:AcrR family transcriptional regulator
MTAAPSATRRERTRAATIDEIKATALDLMRGAGTVDVRFTDIARVMGVTPPALYRYFADRDELLTALITDAYDDLARHVAASGAAAPDDLGARWEAAAQAYREWAQREPERFALILGLPVPGYVAPEEGPTSEAASRALSQLSSLFVEALHAGTLGAPYLREVDPTVEVCAHGKSEDLEVTLPAESFQAMLHAWAALHGFTSLEAYGHLDWMEPAARDALFGSQVTLIARVAGLPEPLGA